MARPPAPPLPLTKKERSGLEGIAASVSLPHRAVREAKGLLMAGDGIANTVIGETLGVSRSTTPATPRHRMPPTGRTAPWLHTVGSLGPRCRGNGRPGD